jgi:hypothetical protein
MYKLLLLIFLSVFCTGCSKYYVTVTRQKIDRAYLASTHINSPDPRQACPPLGQMLVLNWYIPQEILKRNPYISLDVLYWNNTQRCFLFPIKYRFGYANHSLLGCEFAESGGFLTYRAKLITEDGEIYREWTHQLWVNLIEIEDIDEFQISEQEEEMQESAQETNLSVDSQSMQGSVIDTSERTNESDEMD